MIENDNSIQQENQKHSVLNQNSKRKSHLVHKSYKNSIIKDIDFQESKSISEIENMFPIGDTEDDKQNRSVLWKSFDFSGNGDLSLNEVVTSLAGIKQFPKHLVHQTSAITAAYNIAKEYGNDDLEHHQYGVRHSLQHSENLTRKHFKKFLTFLDYYTHYIYWFNEVDKDQSGQLTLVEFEQARHLLQKHWNCEFDYEEEFNKIDKNQSGHIDFDEFALYCIDKTFQLQKQQQEQKEQQENQKLLKDNQTDQQKDQQDLELLEQKKKELFEQQNQQQNEQENLQQNQQQENQQQENQQQQNEQQNQQQENEQENEQQNKQQQNEQQENEQQQNEQENEQQNEQENEQQNEQENEQQNEQQQNEQLLDSNQILQKQDQKSEQQSQDQNQNEQKDNLQNEQLQIQQNEQLLDQQLQDQQNDQLLDQQNEQLLDSEQKLQNQEQQNEQQQNQQQQNELQQDQQDQQNEQLQIQQNEQQLQDAKIDLCDKQNKEKIDDLKKQEILQKINQYQQKTFTIKPKAQNKISKQQQFKEAFLNFLNFSYTTSQLIIHEQLTKFTDATQDEIGILIARLLPFLGENLKSCLKDNMKFINDKRILKSSINFISQFQDFGQTLQLAEKLAERFYNKLKSEIEKINDDLEVQNDFVQKIQKLSEQINLNILDIEGIDEMFDTPVKQFASQQCCYFIANWITSGKLREQYLDTTEEKIKFCLELISNGKYKNTFQLKQNHEYDEEEKLQLTKKQKLLQQKQGQQETSGKQNNTPIQVQENACCFIF